MFISPSHGPLHLPFYPLFEDVEILRTIGDGRVYLSCSVPFSGFVVSSGEILNWKKIKLRPEKKYFDVGDYATIHIKDLSVLIKIENIRKEKPKVQTIDRRFAAPLSNLFIDAQEKIAIPISALLSLLVVASMFVAFKLQMKNPPKLMEELESIYTLPFINSVNLSTAPEALKQKLNREDYIDSVIKYYRELTFLFLGLTSTQTHFMYPSSLEYVQRELRQKNKSLNSFLEGRLIVERLEKTAENKKSLQKMDLPVIYGESFQQELLYIIEKIDNIHRSFTMALEYRREVSSQFRDDPSYDWNNYSSVESNSSKKSTEELSKIKVFNQITNEQAMYKEAETLGERAHSYFLLYEKEREPNPWLERKDVISLKIAPELAQNLSVLNSVNIFTNSKSNAKNEL